MTLVRQVIQDAAVGVGVAATPKGLRSIHQAGCAAAIWQRKPLDRFQRWIDCLGAEALPRARLLLRPGQVRDALNKIADGAGLTAREERTMLIDDAAALATMFCAVMRVSYVRLRLDVVETAAREPFHIDPVVARLVCTYRGAGTQYGISTDGAEPRQVFTVPTGSPILLRGTAWPEPPASGLLHRAPSVNSADMSRLVLVLDPVLDEPPQRDRPRLH